MGWPAAALAFAIFAAAGGLALKERAVWNRVYWTGLLSGTVLFLVLAGFQAGLYLAPYNAGGAIDGFVLRALWVSVAVMAGVNVIDLFTRHKDR